MRSRRKSESPPAADANSRDRQANSHDDGIASAVGSFTHFVADIRSKSTDRVVKAARAIVFALVIAAMVVTFVALLLVGFVRVLDVLLPRGVWLAHLVAAVLCGIIGTLLWRRRRPPAADSTDADLAGGDPRGAR